jgi:hypothetical protein
MLTDLLYEEDAETVKKLKELYPAFANKLIAAWNQMYRDHGLRARITDSFRSVASQDLLYAIGRSTDGKIVTNTKGGMSLHNYGLACDIAWRGTDPYLGGNPNGCALWKAYGEALASVEVVWGGDFKSLVDKPHAERSYGFKISDLESIYQSLGLVGVWEAIDRRRGCPVGSEWSAQRSWLETQKGR